MPTIDWNFGSMINIIIKIIINIYKHHHKHPAGCEIARVVAHFIIKK